MKIEFSKGAPTIEVEYDTAGDDGTATAGDGGVLIIHRYDAGRRRLSVGQVDGATLLPDTPYRLDAAGEFEAVA